MTIWMKRIALTATAVAAVGLLGVSMTQAQNDPIKQRQTVMKSNGDQGKTLKAVVDAKGDAKTMAAAAAMIAQNLSEFPKLFPAGSDKGETKASPDIWTDMAGFAAMAKSGADAALKLEASAKKGDIAVAAADFGELGKVCGACHNKYRLK